MLERSKYFAFEKFAKVDVNKYRKEHLKTHPKKIETNVSPEFDKLENQCNVLQEFGHIEDCITVLDEMAKIDPENEIVLGNKTFFLFDLQRWEEHVETTDKMMELYHKAMDLKNEDYDDMAAHLHDKGLALNHLMRYDEARETFEEALKIKPDDSQLLFAMGNVLGLLDRDDEGEVYFKRVIEMEPPENHEDKVRFYWDKGSALSDYDDRLEEALECFDKALELAPDDGDFWSNKAMILWRMEKNDEAIKYFDKALELDEKNDMALNMKAALFNEKEEFDKALDMINRSLAIEEFWVASNVKGDALVGLERYDEALESYEKALEQELSKKNPDNEIIQESLVSMGKLLKDLGKNEKGEECLKRAKELGWDGK